jgi:hypothetical protein
MSHAKKILVLAIVMLFALTSLAFAEKPIKQYDATITGSANETRAIPSDEKTWAWQIIAQDTDYQIENMKTLDTKTKDKFFDAMNKDQDITATGTVKEYKDYKGFILKSIK